MKRSTLAVLLLFLVRFCPTALGAGGFTAVKETDVKPVTGTIYVLCIGVNDYKSPIFPRLESAVNDATSVAGILTDRFGYAVTLLTNEHADRKAILEVVAAVASNAGPEDAIVFYYAGHGVTLKEDNVYFPYVIPGGEEVGKAYDRIHNQQMALVHEATLKAATSPSTTPTTQVSQLSPEEKASNDRAIADIKTRAAFDTRAVLDEVAVPIVTLKRLFHDSKARHAIMIFDSCFAGAAAIVARDATNDIAEFGTVDDRLIYNFAQFNQNSRSIMTAGTSDQRSWESATSGHGVFTGCLLTELQAIGVEGRTVTQLYGRVQPQVFTSSWRAGPDKAQTPQLRKDGAGEGDFVFVPKPNTTWIDLVRTAVVADAKRERSKQFASRASIKEERRKTDSKLDLLLAIRHILISRNEPEKKVDQGKWHDWFDRVKSRAYAGDPDALAALSYAYQFGLGTTPDPGEAARWAREASATGSAEGAAAMRNAISAGLAERSRLEANEAAASEEDKRATQAVGGSVLMLEGARQKNMGAVLLGGIAVVLASNGDDAGESPDRLWKRVVDSRERARTALKKYATTKDDKSVSESLRAWRQTIVDTKNAAEKRKKLGEEDDLFANYSTSVCESILEPVNNLISQWTRLGPKNVAASFEQTNEPIDQLEAIALFTLAKEKALEDEAKPRRRR